MDKSSQEIATVDVKAKYGKRNVKLKKITGTKRVTYIATLIAAALAFKLIGNAISDNSSIKISIVYIPWMLSGIIMGPLGGATVAFATDVIGQLIIPTGGAPIPLIVLSNTLFGFITGLIFKIPKLDNRLKLLISTVAVLFICTLGLTTYALADFRNVSFGAQFVLRLPQVPIVCLNAAIIGFLFPLLEKMKLIAPAHVKKSKKREEDEEQAADSVQTEPNL